MDTRLEILDSLKKEFELEKEVSFGAYIAYVTSIDDLAYMTDEEVRRLIDWDVEVGANKSWHDIKPGRCNIELFDEEYHQVMRQKEQIAYERYKAKVKDRVFFQLEEVLPYSEFLGRFDNIYCSQEDLDYESDITVINHNSDFYDEIPHRYVPMYVCARKGDDYTFIDTNSNKIPDAYELFTFVSNGHCLHYTYDREEDMRQMSAHVEADEWFALIFDTEGGCRATSYYKWAHFGMSVRPGKKEVEFYSANQAIEIFHELFGKCKTFIDHVFGEYNGEG